MSAPITSDFLGRLAREVAPGETARFQIGDTLIEFVKRPEPFAAAGTALFADLPARHRIPLFDRLRPKHLRLS